MKGMFMKNSKVILGIAVLVIGAGAAFADFQSWGVDEPYWPEFDASVSQSGNWPDSGHATVDFASQTEASLDDYQCGFRNAPASSDHHHVWADDTGFYQTSREWF